MAEPDLAEVAALGGRYDEAALSAELTRPIATVLVATVPVAERGEIPGGYLVMWTVGDVAEVHDLFVAEDRRRQGLGRALLDHAKALVAELQLEVRADNEAALALYRRSGFRKVAERAAYYADGADAWLMSLGRSGASPRAG